MLIMFNSFVKYVTNFINNFDFFFFSNVIISIYFRRCFAIGMQCFIILKRALYYFVAVQSNNVLFHYF